MNQELRRLNEQRIGLREEISRLVAELEELETEMKAKMVENLTVDQLLSILDNTEETETVETETVETEVVEDEENEDEENEEDGETILTRENIRQAVGNEIEQLVRSNCADIEIEETTTEENTNQTNNDILSQLIENYETSLKNDTTDEEIQIVDNSESNCPHITSDQVTYDMLTEEMHNAEITLVGVQYQQLYVAGESPTIGQRVRLIKHENNNTYGIIDDGRTIGLFPQSDDKINQLERIGARYKKNRDITPDHPILEKEFKVVGHIPGCFIFLDPVEPEVEDETISEVNEPDMERLEGTASTISEARAIFNSCKNNCTIDGNIIEDENFFIIRYLNHPAQSMEEYHQECCIAKV